MGPSLIHGYPGAAFRGWCWLVLKLRARQDDYSKTGLTRAFIEEHNIHVVAHGSALAPYTLHPTPYTL